MSADIVLLPAVPQRLKRDRGAISWFEGMAGEYERIGDQQMARSLREHAQVKADSVRQQEAHLSLAFPEFPG